MQSYAFVVDRRYGWFGLLPGPVDIAAGAKSARDAGSVLVLLASAAIPPESRLRPERARSGLRSK
jgi:hypothetical protein